MGVTYKIKQEVVDVIVQRKKADPSLSCRKLASILQEIFKVEISKSSINAVIKEFSLSNPVGRRSVAAPKNFFIPSEKKQQLLAQVTSFLEPSVERVQAVEIKEDGPVVEPVHLAPDIMGIKDTRLIDEKGQEVPEVGQISVCPRILLTRLFMQDVMRKPVLGHILARAADMEAAAGPFLEAAIFLKAAGMSSVEEVHGERLETLCTTLGLDLARTEEVLGRFLGKDLTLLSLAMALEVELEAALVQGALFCGISDTGRNICFTADLGVFIGEAEEGPLCPAFKAIEGAVDRFGTRKEPLVFDLAAGFDPAAVELVRFLDGRTRDHLDKVVLLDRGGQKLWELTVKAGARYALIMGTGVDERLLSRIRFDPSSQPVFFQDVLTAEPYELKEGVLVVDEDQALALRAIVVSRQEGQEKKVILTNVLKKSMDSSGIVEKYMEKHGIFDILNHFDKESSIFSHTSMGKIWMFDQNETIFKLLDRIYFCFEKIGEINLIQEGTEKIESSVCPRTHRIHVKLLSEKAFSQPDVFKAMIVRLNHCGITDYMGRRVFFSSGVPVDK